MKNTMYTLFIGNKNYSSWSLRPWVLMRALKIPFEEKLVPFDVGTSFDKFRSFSNSGLVPCLHDGETIVWDSLAIAEYLAGEIGEHFAPPELLRDKVERGELGKKTGQGFYSWS